jgi:hypothetical protein
MKYTLTHSEKSKGWTSFWSFMPDFMLKMNNRFYSIKNGQLHLHNEDTGHANSFYGTSYPSKLKMIFNEANGEDKIFKTIVLEGNRPWNVAVKTNMANSTIKSTEFEQKESRFFGYIRKNEDPNDYHGNTIQGVGVIKSISGLVISFSSVSNQVSTGDVFFQLDGNTETPIGTIEHKTINTITLHSFANQPVVGLFGFSKKNARIEGGEIRGYYMEVDLEFNEDSKMELFAVNTNATKSGITLNQ